MGTNYYFHDDICKCCGRSTEMHIGKSSAGWCFALHVYPDLGINYLEDWKTWFDTPETIIKNEYGELISTEAMLNIITDRSNVETKFSKEFLSRNHATLGPNNLLRSKLDGRHCIGHGPGTYDYFVEDFS